jgi:hypothetical protein
MLHLKYFVAGCMLALLTVHSANAGFITQSDFDSTAILTDLNNLGIPNPSNVAAPLTVDVYTFTTDDGQLRYTNSGVSNSGALSDNTDLGFINIAIASGANVTQFGFLVGLAGPAQQNAETVSFFDTNSALLGSVDVSSAGGFTFVGFEDTAGFIGSALVTDTDLNSTVVTVDNLISNPTPLPATLPLFAGGLGALGLLGWRRKRKNADAF